MSGETINSTPNELPVSGAFEVFEGNREELITLTRNGELLQPGDVLPAVPGVEPEGRPFVLHTVNAFGTETCDTCTDVIEAFHLSYPEVPVYSLTKQSADEIAAEDGKRVVEGKKPVTHQRLSIDQDTAVDLGAALAPGEGADADFWPTALRRTLVVVGADGKIIDIQQPDDQEQKPDWAMIYEAAQPRS